jgi:DNA-directed RNA polymerase subunit RPC12/RpoP
MAGADVIACSACGSEELRGSRQGAVILLTCESCGHEFERTPRPSCPRCGTPDPFESEHMGWEHEDGAEEREGEPTGSGDALRGQYRCRKCHLTWGVELDRREGRSTDGGAAPEAV